MSCSERVLSSIQKRKTNFAQGVRGGEERRSKFFFWEGQLLRGYKLLEIVGGAERKSMSYERNKN